MAKRYLQLQDGSVFAGWGFGADAEVSGEVVFATGMTGYPETLTDPSFKRQILVLTYPLIGNYGVALMEKTAHFRDTFESRGIKVEGLVVSEVCAGYSHYSASQSLDEWLKKEGIPAIFGVDTRAVTVRLREKGTMLGRMSEHKSDQRTVADPNRENLVAMVSTKKLRVTGAGRKKILLIDCGVKEGIIKSLVKRDAMVFQVPWNYDPFIMGGIDFEGVVITNGPGDPKMVPETVAVVKKLLVKKVPVLGICLGNQILALASGADTYKLKYGHRSHNQPVVVDGGSLSTSRCFLTTQNHGYAVDKKTLKGGWKEWFTNLNDGTNEGLKHKDLPFMSVQFHPEGKPGPEDTNWVFDEFLRCVT